MREHMHSGWKPASLGLAGLVACLVVLGGSASRAPSRAAAATVGGPPAVVTGGPLPSRPGTLGRGTLVRPRHLGVRAFLDAERGFALASLPTGETYPAATVDGGRTWRIDGPVFHIPAADGPAVVAFGGAAGPDTYYAFGGGGSVVDVSTDGGRHWRTADLAGLVLAVTPSVSDRGELIAAVEELAAAHPTMLVYVSRDGGRHWRRTSRFTS